MHCSYWLYHLNRSLVCLCIYKVLGKYQCHQTIITQETSCVWPGLCVWPGNCVWPGYCVWPGSRVWPGFCTFTFYPTELFFTQTLSWGREPIFTKEWYRQGMISELEEVLCNALANTVFLSLAMLKGCVLLFLYCWFVSVMVCCIFAWMDLSKSLDYTSLSVRTRQSNSPLSCL